MELYQHQRTKYDIPLNHLEYNYIEECKDVKELEKILKILRSGHEGHFPQMEVLAEERLNVLDPKNKLLRKPGKVLKTHDLNEEERSKLDHEMKSWESKIKVNEMDLKYSKDIGFESDLPVRGLANPIIKQEPKKKSKKKHNNKVKPREYSEWDKLDIEAELKSVDETPIQDTCHAFNPIPLQENINSSDMSSEAKEIRANYERTKGNEAFRCCEFDEALIYYNRSLSIHKSILALNNRAQTYIKLKKWNQALEDCNEVIQLDFENIKGFLRRAVALQGLTRFQQACNDINFILSKEPNNKQAQAILKEITQSQGIKKLQNEEEINKHKTNNIHPKKMKIIEINDEKDLYEEDSDLNNPEKEIITLIDTTKDPLFDSRNKDYSFVDVEEKLKESLIKNAQSNSFNEINNMDNNNNTNVKKEDMVNKNNVTLPMAYSDANKNKINTEECSGEIINNKSKINCPENINQNDNNVTMVAENIDKMDKAAEYKENKKSKRKKIRNRNKGLSNISKGEQDKSLLDKPITIDKKSEKDISLLKNDELEKEKCYQMSKNDQCEQSNFVSHSANQKVIINDLCPSENIDMQKNNNILKPMPNNNNSSKAKEPGEVLKEKKEAQIIFNGAFIEEQKIVLKEKEEGNKLFRLGRYADAIECYSRALLLKANDKKGEELLYGNRAACKFKIGDCRGCIEDCNIVLKTKPTCCKALLRKAIACEHLEDYQQAYVNYKSIPLESQNDLVSQGANRCANMLINMYGTDWRSKLPPFPQGFHQSASNSSFTSLITEYQSESSENPLESNTINSINQSINLQSFTSDVSSNETKVSFKIDSSQENQYSNDQSLLSKNNLSQMHGSDYKILASNDCSNFNNEKSEFLIENHNILSESQSLNTEKDATLLKSENDFLQQKTEGNDYFEKGNYLEAINCFSKCIELNPAEVAPYTNRALCYIKLQKYEQVLEDCNQALILDSTNSKALFRRALAYKFLENWEKSKFDLETLLKIDPRNGAAKKELDEFKRIEIEQDRMSKKKNKMRERINVDAVEEIEMNSSSTSNSKYKEKCKKSSPVKHNYLNQDKNNVNGLIKEKRTYTRKKNDLTDVANSSITPITPYEFMHMLKTARKTDNIEDYILIMDRIEPTQLPKILSNKLENDILMIFIRCISFYFKSGKNERGIDFLENLAKADRFDMVTMFFSEADKKEIGEMFEDILNIVDETRLKSLKFKYLN